MSSTDPDLRTRVAQAIRDEAETHNCIYQEGINVDEMAHRVIAAISGEQAAFGPAETIARLRQQLDAVRDVVEDMKATTGARWWADQLELALGGEQPPPVKVNPEITELTAKLLTHGVPACPSRRHPAHPGYDCEEQDALAEAWAALWERTGRELWEHAARAGEVGPALRGPNYPHDEPDPGPLRAIAEQALGVREPGTVYRNPRADDPGYDPITGYRTWAEVQADPPQPTGIYEQVLAMFGGPLPPYDTTPPCARCKGHGVVPDWTRWDHHHGEPKPKPCPDCTSKEPS